MLMKSGLFGCMCVSCGTWCSLCSTSRQPQNISNQIVKTWKDFNGNYWFLDRFSKKALSAQTSFQHGFCAKVWHVQRRQVRLRRSRRTAESGCRSMGPIYSPITRGWLLSQQEPMATSLLVEGGLSFSFKMWCSQSSRQFIGKMQPGIPEKARTEEDLVSWKRFKGL